MWIDLESLVKAESGLDIIGSYIKDISKAIGWMKYAAVDRAVSQLPSDHCMESHVMRHATYHPVPIALLVQPRS